MTERHLRKGCRALLERDPPQTCSTKDQWSPGSCLRNKFRGIANHARGALDQSCYFLRWNRHLSVSGRPTSKRSCRAEVSGRILARIADCILVSFESRPFGTRLPKNSDMYLSIFGGMQDSRSGLGCSLNKASLSSFERDTA